MKFFSSSLFHLLLLLSTSLHGTDLVSSSSSNVQGELGSSGATLSEDGRFVVFETKNSLVPEDDDTYSDVYLKDRVTREVTLISVALDGSASYGTSGNPFISANGKFVAFSANGNDLDENDEGEIFQYEVYVRDLEREVTTRVSVAPNGDEGDASSGEASLSADGSMVAFRSRASNFAEKPVGSGYQMYVREVSDPGSLRLISADEDGTPGNGDSTGGFVSAGGDFVVFQSTASNLVENDGPHSDIFRYDLSNNSLVLVTTTPNGEGTNGGSVSASISEDGTTVAYRSSATDLVSPSDSSYENQIFVTDLGADGSGETVLVSRGSEGVVADENAAFGRRYLSDDGQTIVFATTASNLGGPETPEFNSTNVYRHDRATGLTAWLPVSRNGTAVDGFVDELAISGDGESVVFKTDAQNLVPDDTNGSMDDVFVWPDLPKPRAAAPVADKSAAKAALLKKIKKLKKKMKAAKRKKQVAKAKRFKKKIKKLAKQLRSL